MNVHIVVGSEEHLAGLKRDARSRGRIWWTCPKTAEVGDHAFILILGNGVHAHGIVSSTPKPAANYPGRYGAHLRDVELLAAPVPLPLLRRQFPKWGYPRSAQSYTTVREPLATRLCEFFGASDGSVVEDISRLGAAVEGKARKSQVVRYERDRSARKRCLRKWGCRCQACGMEFGKVYGRELEGFIHVHHLESMASRGGEYTFLPERDLRPLCPNCHAVAHRSDPPMSIAAIRSLLKRIRRDA